MSKNYFDTLCSKEAPTTMSKPTGKKKAKTDKLALKKIKQQLLAFCFCHNYRYDTLTTNVVDSTGKIFALEILSSAIGCQKKDDGGVIMRVIVCVDDNGGMLFNHRRQSRDRVLCERVLQMADERDCSVYMNTYSAKIFPEDDRIAVSENYLEEAGVQDLCFVEKEPLATYFDKIDECIVFKWNRVYPADQYLDIDISKMTKVQEEEFVGFSHEKITMEVYER